MKRNGKKRILAMLLILCIMVGLIPPELAIRAEAVSGIDSLTCSSFISNTEHQKYIDTMMRYYINNNSKLTTALDNGQSVIFMFEGGSDNYPSYGYSLTPSNTRNQAVCIVVQKNSSGNAEIVFYSENCSSVPGNPQNCTGAAYYGSTTLMDGIYSVYTTNHTGPYGALQVNTGTGYYTPPGDLDGYTNGASGINVHTRSTNTAGGSNWSWAWSEGCQVIGTGGYTGNEFNAFMKAVTGISYNVWIDYPNKTFNTITTGTTVGYYVVDRQLGYDGLSALYNSTALANITAYSTAAKEEAMATYANQCTAYPSHCQIEITGSTSVMTQPCSSSTDSSSTKIETASAGDVYTATKLYMNTQGNLWYEVISKTGEVGHIVANKTSYVKQLLTDITISGADIPSGHVAGDVFAVTGTIKSSYNQISSVAACIYSGFGISGTAVTGGSATVNGKYYLLDNSAVDYDTAFNELSTGNYTYVILANYVNYYATGNSTYSTNTGKVLLVNEYFMVVSTATSQSSCSHTYKDYVIKAATCTAAGTTVQACTTCGKINEKSVSATGHSYGSWVTETQVTCTTDGLQKRTCTSCGKVESQTVAATGHNYIAEVVEANCQQHEHTIYTCDNCGDSYLSYAEEMFSEWLPNKPEGIADSLIETKTQYRYSDYETTTSTSSSLDGYTQTGSSWQQTGTGSVTYVKSWPSGFSTSSSLYTTYNKTPKTASETTTAKTTINSDAIVGYLYFHWCANSYTAGPINRVCKPEKTTGYETFHAFYSTTDPDSLYQVTDSDGVSHQYENGDCCTDTYWYFVTPVYKQTYTTYQKLYSYGRWTDWTEWSDTVYTASDTRQVETQTLYRYVDAELGDHNFVDGVCTVCGEIEDTSGCSHTYGNWYTETAVTCTTDGLRTRSCSLCGRVQTEVLTATGHNYTPVTYAATCIELEHTTYTCEKCGDTYTNYVDLTMGEWLPNKPEGVEESLIETKIQYRYSDYETTTSTSTSLDGYTQLSSEWKQSGTGSVTYVKSWPSGFSTSSSLYTTYNKTPKTASETTTAKTTINSDAIVGYLYFHWCANSYTAGPINRVCKPEKTTGYETFHAFYSTTDPDSLYQVTDSDGVSHQYENGDCCTDTYWYFVTPVYKQTYTTYQKQFTYYRWTDWSEWSDTVYTASDTRKVETQTLYRYANAGYGDHNYVNGVCTVCGATKPVIECNHEDHDITGTCTSCGTSVEHTFVNGICSVCGVECDHSFVSGVCSVCGLKQETSVSLSTYLTYCDDYAANLSVMTTTTTALMSYPCSGAVQANSSVNAKVTADTVLFVKALYKNTVGEYWYQILRYGKTYYVKAADTTLLDHLIGDVTATDVQSPASLGYGSVFPIGGTITSELNELVEVTASMYSGSNITKTPVITASDSVTGNSYTLDDSNVDYNLSFNSLAAGDYTYLLTAEAVSYYVDDNDELAKASKTVVLEEKPCIVTNASSPNSVGAFGIDVSYWNGDIDWAAVAEEVDFVIMRASWETTADEKFYQNADGCTENGIPFGVYVYSYAESVDEAVAEAEYVLSLVKNYDLALPIYFDIEDEVHTVLTSSEKKAIVKAFADTIEAAGYQPGLYTFLSWFNSYFSDDYYYNTLPKWVAQIETSNCSYTGGVRMWQYSWVGSISGISGDVDCNYYYGEFPGKSSDTSYLSKCTSYPSNLDVTTKSSVTLKKYPCSSSVNSSSTDVKTVSASTALHVTGLYKNTAGELWYQVEIDGTCGYVLASNVTVKGYRYDDVAVVDPEMASNLSVGSVCYLQGDLVSQYNKMTALYAKVYSGEDTLADPAIESGYSTTTKFYSLNNSEVDYGLAFNELTAGYYTYEISADVKNYYVNTSGTLTSKTENVVVWVSPLTVGSSTISHTHTQVTDAAVPPTCSSTGLSAGVHCSTCHEILAEQTVVSATGHSAGSAVKENVIDGVSYEEVVYCAICGTELSRTTVEIEACTHEDHDQTGACTECGEAVEHTFEQGSCTVCGLPCEHSWEDGVCTICGLVCEHDWEDCTCTICGATVEPGSLSGVTLTGSFNEWSTEPNMVIVDGNVVYITMELAAGSHTFKILEDGIYYGNNGTIVDTTTTTSETGWIMETTANDCTLSATYSGSYTFTFNKETKALVVTYEMGDLYLRGSFNEWGTDLPMVDNGDGTYTIKTTLTAGSYEFKIGDEDYSPAWPAENYALEVPRKANVTVTLDVNTGEITVIQEALEFVVTFVDYDGTVLSTQTVATGSAATAPTVPARAGYAFSGWDQTFDNVTGDLTITAQYVEVDTTGKLKIDISGGNGFSISVDDGTARPQGNFYYNTKIEIGSKVTVTANEVSENNFLGWVNMATNQIVSTDMTYTFYTSGNDHYGAIYTYEIEGVNLVIFMNDKSSQILDMQYYAAGDEIIVPAEPANPSYDFAGWQYTVEEIQAKLEAGEDVTVNATWTKKQVYVNVTVNGGTVTDNSGMNDSGQYLAAYALTITADEAPEGQKFAYWTDGNGVIKSYNSTYKFYPAADTAMTAVFVDEAAEIDYQVLVSVDTADTTSVDGKIIFYFSWYVPEEQEGLTYIHAGILGVNKQYYNESTFYAGTSDSNVYDRGPATGNAYDTAENTFSWTKGSISEGDTWVVRAYVQYYDADGNLITVYSDLVEATK